MVGLRARHGQGGKGDNSSNKSQLEWPVIAGAFNASSPTNPSLNDSHQEISQGSGRAHARTPALAGKFAPKQFFCQEKKKKQKKKATSTKLKFMQTCIDFDKILFKKKSQKRGNIFRGEVLTFCFKMFYINKI